MHGVHSNGCDRTHARLPCVDKSNIQVEHVSQNARRSFLGTGTTFGEWTVVKRSYVYYWEVKQFH